MTGEVPKPALALALAGLIPFLWGAATLLLPALAQWGQGTVGPRFVGPYVLLSYGSVILSFMSGVLWGFASRGEGAVATSGYALSVLPALWVFLFVGGGPVPAAIHLMFGFAGLLALDWMFWRQRLAPAWWMGLRAPLTAIVLLCLVFVVL